MGVAIDLRIEAIGGYGTQDALGIRENVPQSGVIVEAARKAVSITDDGDGRSRDLWAMRLSIKEGGKEKVGL